MFDVATNCDTTHQPLLTITYLSRVQSAAVHCPLDLSTKNYQFIAHK